MYGYIYKTTNLINGKIYIGKKTSDHFDPDYKGSGKYLWNAIDKYGWNNFLVEFLCECSSLEDMNAKEIMLIDKFNARDHSIGYNIAEGGDGGNTFSGLSPEDKDIRRQHMSRAMRGRVLSDTHKARIGMSNKGKIMSPESRVKMSKIRKGRKLSSEHRAKLHDYSIANNTVARLHSPEVRAKAAETRRGATVSDETKAKISQAIRGNSNPFYGKHHTEATKKHLSECQRGANSKCYGVPRTEEIKQKISEGCKGRKFHLTCRSCGKEFIGNSGSIKYCPECKKSGGM